MKTKKPLMRLSVSLLIGLSLYLNSCDFLRGFEQTFDYYEGFILNNSSYDVKYVIKGIDDSTNPRDTLFLNSKQRSMYRFFVFSGEKIEINLLHDYYFRTESTTEIYIGNTLVKSWQTPRGDFGDVNSPYNYNSWEIIDFENPIIEEETLNTIIGENIFTITDEDLDLSVLEETTVTEQDFDAVE